LKDASVRVPLGWLDEQVGPTQTILIVEDDSGVAITFARMLWLSGYTVVTACDGHAGLRKFLERRPDAVLVDLRLPSMDGVAFVRRLRAIESNHRLPVAIITGDYMLDDATVCELRRLNANVYFKPLWLDDLVSITRQLLSM